MSRNLYKIQDDNSIRESLREKVLFSVAKAKKRSEYRLIGVWSLLSFVFSPVTFVLLSTLHERLVESSTFEYLSMLANDAEARSLYSKEILYAVYDTIPLPGALLSLLSLVLVVLFYAKTMKLLMATFLSKSSLY